MYFKLIFQELLIHLMSTHHRFRAGCKYSWENDIPIFTEVYEIRFPLNTKVFHNAKAH